MTRQTMVGGGLIAVAVVMFLSGLGDRIADLSDWHQLGTTQVVGAILKDAAQIAMAALGGTMLPGIGQNKGNGA